MTLVLWLVIALVPFLLGKGTLKILYGKKNIQGLIWSDSYLVGLFVYIGLTEAAHCMAVFLKWHFSFCIKIQGFFLIAVCIAALVFFISEEISVKTKRRWKKEKQAKPRELKPREFSISWFLFGVVVLLQVILLVTGQERYFTGDITLETVNSFLTTDSVYQVNPLTGQAYTQGLPLRLEILCLPTLYAALCKWSGLSAYQVTEMVSVAVLLAGYLAYGRLAEWFFGQSKKKKGVFLLLISLLFWAGDYMPMIDGFGIRHCGYQGTTIRSIILLPYIINLCLREKWKLIVLCIAAEACIVWTFYGFGACFFIAFLWILGRKTFYKKEKERKAKNKGGCKWNFHI